MIVVMPFTLRPEKLEIANPDDAVAPVVVVVSTVLSFSRSAVIRIPASHVVMSASYRGTIGVLASRTSVPAVCDFTTPF